MQVEKLIPSDSGGVDVFAYAPGDFEVVSCADKQPRKPRKRNSTLKGVPTISKQTQYSLGER